MNFSRRGLLFSPYKLKRTCDYFALPVTIPTKKQTKYSKIIQISFKFFGKIKEIVKELLFPDARINISPCIPGPENYSECPIKDVPFFETPKTIPKVKKPPPDNIVFEKRKKCRSSASQTEFMLSIKDFSPSFAFFRDKDPVAWLDKLKENKEREVEETKVNRTVVRKIIRRTMDLVQCDQLQICPRLNSAHCNNLLTEQEKMIEVEMKFDDPESHSCEMTETSSSTKSESSHKVTEVPYIPETLPYHPAPNNTNPFQSQSSPPISSFSNSDSLQLTCFPPPDSLSPVPVPVPAPTAAPSTPIAQDSNLETAKKLFVQNPLEKLPEPQNLFQSNPFLNTSFIQKAEVPFKFGQNETPPTAQKINFTGFGQVNVSKFEVNQAGDTDMVIESCGLGTGVSSGNSIQTPNLQSNCLFTQTNPQELYNKTPSLFPNLSQAVPQAPNFQTYPASQPVVSGSSVPQVSMTAPTASLFSGGSSSVTMFSTPSSFVRPLTNPAQNPQLTPNPVSNPQFSLNPAPAPASTPSLFSAPSINPSNFPSSSSEPQRITSSAPAPALFSHLSPSPASNLASSSNPVPSTLFGASSTSSSSNTSSTPQSGSFKLGKIFSSKPKK